MDPQQKQRISNFLFGSFVNDSLYLWPSWVFEVVFSSSYAELCSWLSDAIAKDTTNSVPWFDFLRELAKKIKNKEIRELAEGAIFDKEMRLM